MELNIIQKRIYEIRGVRVMLDFDLADLYQVETKVLKQSVIRNLDRFPEDFMFELTPEEYNCLIISLRSQIVTSNEKGGRRYMPCSAERNDEDNFKAINDLSEDMRQEIDNIYQAIAVLSVQRPAEPQNTVKKIGFK